MIVSLSLLIESSPTPLLLLSLAFLTSSNSVHLLNSRIDIESQRFRHLLDDLHKTIVVQDRHESRFKLFFVIAREVEGNVV